MRNLPLTLGPCVIESREQLRTVAEYCDHLRESFGLEVLFKASYDKANRSSVHSFRGVGMEKGLGWLAEIKQSYNFAITSDVHSVEEVQRLAKARILNVIQIPAFLCRQTDLIHEAARTCMMTGANLAIKKGQFMSPEQMAKVIEKAMVPGLNNRRISIIERGYSFGYNNLVVDFRGIKTIQDMGVRYVFDATHSTQNPGSLGDCTGAGREFAMPLAAAAIAAGADGIFAEIHPDPSKAKCDAASQLKIGQTLTDQLVCLNELYKHIKNTDNILYKPHI